MHWTLSTLDSCPRLPREPRPRRGPHIQPFIGSSRTSKELVGVPRDQDEVALGAEPDTQAGGSHKEGRWQSGDNPCVPEAESQGVRGQGSGKECPGGLCRSPREQSASERWMECGIGGVPGEVRLPPPRLLLGLRGHTFSKATGSQERLLMQPHCISVHPCGVGV